VKIPDVTLRRRQNRLSAGSRPWPRRTVSRETAGKKIGMIINPSKISTN
jgi:hypothetical protein